MSSEYIKGHTDHPKDWSGNKKSTFTTIGASNHSTGKRADNDYYATDPSAIDALFGKETFSKAIWEPACGAGHLSKRMKELGKDVMSTDLVDRGYNNETLNFLNDDPYEKMGVSQPYSCTFDIITNPPYSYAMEFCERALFYGTDKVAMFLKLTFLEGQKRRKFFNEHPPRRVLVFSKRMNCFKNGDMTKTNLGATSYAWFVWYKGYTGKPEIEWI